ncbi:unnamed protein product [Macrosiphum euphorbiae]|uniref:Uncharacterized protein n=1 Tax=Macrosiphum euphorbiae TaxID=13131 RepID=A0AAV0XLP5_9HEMI|nr:unnamed protein product [Macrosiphum euphorbiae]
MCSRSPSFRQPPSAVVTYAPVELECGPPVTRECPSSRDLRNSNIIIVISLAKGVFFYLFFVRSVARRSPVVENGSASFRWRSYCSTRFELLFETI